MSIFDDKKLENLDWMTKITETIESELNVALSKLPDEIVIDKETINHYLMNSYYRKISVSDILRPIIGVTIKSDLTQDDYSKLSECFKFEIVENSIFNATTQEFNGEARLIKTIATFDDESLQKTMGMKGIFSLRDTLYWRNDSGMVGRINEVLDSLGGCEEHRKGRSARKKIYAVQRRLRAIFTGNEWRIRDAELANKVGFWISSYIKDGNLAAFTNFCKLKVMTHNNMPIYSMEEETL